MPLIDKSMRNINVQGKIDFLFVQLKRWQIKLFINSMSTAAVSRGLIVGITKEMISSLLKCLSIQISACQRLKVQDIFSK